MDDGCLVVATLLDAADAAPRRLVHHRVSFPGGSAAPRVEDLRSSPPEFSRRVFGDGAARAIVEQGILDLSAGPPSGAKRASGL